MTVNVPDYKILIQYEREKKTAGTSLVEFANENNAGPQLQLELIRLDSEIRLKLGDTVSVGDYMEDYPYLREELRDLLAKVKTEFCSTFCPLKERFGPFPMIFGDYLIEKEIGRGGMGVVYQAQRRNEAEKCAIKVPFTHRESYHNEHEILSTLDHPNLVKLREFGIIDDVPFTCTNLIDGKPLDQILNDEMVINSDYAVLIVEHIARGLSHVHQSGVVHFDVKTGNIMIDKRGTPILTDFGLAKQESKICDLEDSEVDFAFGSPHYMAPELFQRRFGKVGFAADIYSLGVVLYELLTGRRPFFGQPKSLAKQICEYPPARPTDFEHVRIDTRLEAVCLQAIQKSTCQRTHSMEAFIDNLEAWRLPSARLSGAA